MKKRVVVIGLDGMPWHILRVLLDRGTMSNVKKLVANGARGTVRSTIPPYTSAAWCSITTGVNPGKHGVFSFDRFEKGSYTTRLVNSLDIMYPRLHEIMMMNRRKCVIINLPHSYPFIKSKKCVIITDWLTPKLIIYPEEVRHLASAYNYSANWKFSNEIKLSELENRIDAVMNLFEKTNWDLFFVVFTEPDWIMHLAYDAIVDYHKDTTLRIYKAFKMIDKFIGHVISRLDANDLLIILSDHGFSEYDKAIYVNSILSRYGLVSKRMTMRGKTDILSKLYDPRASEIDINRFRIPIPRLVIEVINRNIAVREMLWKIATKISELPMGYRILANLADKYLKLSYSIDFPSSRAFTSKIPFGIYVNSKRIFKSGVVESEKEPKIIDEIINLLSRLTDPITNRRIFSLVAKRSEVYWGKYTERAPQIILIPNMDAGYVCLSSFYPKIIRRKSEKSLFLHSMYGIFIAYGNSVRSNLNLGILNTYDLVPTLLHYLDLPVPSDTDGNILSNMFIEGSDAQESFKSIDYLERWKVARYIMKKHS